MQLLNNVLGYISNTKLWGFIPLDVIMHLLVSYLIMFIMLWRKVRFRYAYLVVLLLSLIKEFYDSFTLTNVLSENIKDLLVSMCFPTLLLVVWKIKGRKI